MSGWNPVRPNRITKGRLGSHRGTPTLALMLLGTRGQSMHLNRTGQRRIYCLTMAGNLIIYSDKQNVREAAEKAARGRGRTWKERAEGRMEREDRWEETRRRRYQSWCKIVLSCFTISKRADKDITFHTRWCRCHFNKSLNYVLFSAVKMASSVLWGEVGSQQNLWMWVIELELPGWNGSGNMRDLRESDILARPLFGPSVEFSCHLRYEPCHFIAKWLFHLQNTSDCSGSLR